MKKLLLLFCLFFITPASFALNVVVESQSNISKETESADFSAKVLEAAEFTDGTTLEEGAVLNGKIIKAVEAKRGKRNAYIVIQPVSYTIGNTVKTIEDKNLEAKVVGYSKKDYKKMGLDAGLAVGGYFVKGLGQIFYFSKGLIMPDDGKSRVSSAIHNVYENTPFVYIEKGEEVEIEEGDMLVLKFYHADVPKWRILKRQK